MKKKTLGGIIAAVCLLLIVAVVLVLSFGGNDEPPVVETTEPVTTEPDATDPSAGDLEDEPDVEILQAGAMLSHENGKDGDKGIYFKMKPNDIPVDTSWATEFKPSTKGAIQLIRGGETFNIAEPGAGMIIKYSETEYYLKLDEWIIRQYYPITDGDILLVGGIFRKGDVYFQIEPTYIAIAEGLVFFSAELPTELPVNVVSAGTMQSHPKGRISTGFYFTMDKNSIPVSADWSIEYKPNTEDAVKLIRDGKTYNIGNTAAGMLIKYSDTEYFLKLEEWIIKDLYPLQDGDIIVVDGKFANSGTGVVARISKTYIALAEGLLFFSQEMPTDLNVDVIRTGPMQSHPKGKEGTDGFYFSMPENDIPVPQTDAWAVEYFPASADVIKLIRDGKTYSIGNPDAGTLIKFGETDYYLKTQEWMIKDYFPIRDGDVLVVEGRFVNAGTGVVFEIEKSCISYAEGILTFSTEEPGGEGPAVEVLQAGPMQSHPKGKEGTDGFYFSMPENDIPVPQTDAWAVEYFPASADVIKLIRDGKTYDIGNTLAGTLIKFGETDYYLKTQEWMIKDHFPIRDGDVLVVEGRFVNAGTGVVFEIEKSCISYAEGILAFSTEEPGGEGPAVEVLQAGPMQSHPKGKEGTDGFYFSMPENDIPVPQTDAWAVEYFPASADVIKLIRDGKTYDIGNTLAGTLIKFGETDYYLKTQEWMIKDYFPIRDGDVLVVEDRFVNAGTGVVFEIEKSCISYAEGILTFSTEEPGEEGPAVEILQAGPMLAHPNGKNDLGIYFKLADNDLSYDQWTIEFMPNSADVIKLIRDGETYDIANVLAGTIVKFAQDEYFLKLEQWIIKDYFPIRDGDILVVEGRFLNAGLGEVFEIEKTYISINAGMPYFSTSYPTGEEGPTVINGGTMDSHPNGWSSSAASAGGLYFTLAANEAPFAADWSTRFTPAETAVVKLIRDGVTCDVANTAAEMLVKYGETDYYLEFWPISCKPLKAGDVLVVEGRFVNAAEEAVLDIERTYITLSNGVAIFSTEEPGQEQDPTEPDVTEPEETQPPAEGSIDAGMMSSHPNGWNAGGNNGLYFTLAANDAPYDGWSIEYGPLAETNIKLIRDGVTTDIARPVGTVVKISDDGYYLKLENYTIGDSAPIVPGDVLIVEGNFVCIADQQTILYITKTYITVGDGYQLTFGSAPAEEEPTEPETTAPDDGPLMPHNNGVQTSGSETLIYAVMTENSGAYNDWETEYTPADAANLKLIRDGVSYDVGNPGQGTLIKFSATEYCLKLAPWTVTGSKLPLVAGDQLVVEGAYVGKTGTSCEGSTIRIAKTTITCNADGTVTFEYDAVEEDPTEPDDGSVKGGAMAAHPTNGWTAEGGLYFTMAANDAPGGSWSIRYTPTAESCIKLVRDGVTQDVAHTLRETLVKYADTEYYFEFWTLGDYKPIVAGDVLIVEGNFTHGDTVLNIEKTVITFNADGTAVFESADREEESTEPEEGLVDAGVMAANSESGWTGTGGLYFTMAANDAPFVTDWSTRFTPVTNAVIKLTRDGVTTDVANTAAEMIVKYSETEYYMEFWPIALKPMRAGDVLTVEGDFVNGDTTLRITKTVITFNADGTAVFESADREEEPSEPDVTEPETTEPETTEPETTEPETTEPETQVIEAGAMGVCDGVTSSASILYFSLAENDLPAHLTKSDYRPVSADVIKLVRDGVTYDVGDPSVKTVVKQTANTNKYRLIRSALTMDLQDGDMLIVSGDFTGGRTDGADVYTFRVATTYIVIEEDQPVFYTADPRENP